jgi:energy-coupling factor transporter ATP-binding protein EcfA2
VDIALPGRVGYNAPVLKSIRLKNFKLHEDTSIEAAPITAFIGPNNTGKSSIFQALLLLRQAASRNDRFLCQPPASHQPPPSEPYQYSPGLTVDVGTFDEVIRRSGDDIHFEFSGTVHARKPLHEVGQASVSAQLRVRENRLVFHTGVIDCSGAPTNWEFVEGVVPKNAGLNLKGPTFLVQPLQTFQLTSPGGFQDTNTALARETVLRYNETSMWLGALPSNLLGSVHPIYALRGFEEWGYPIADYPPARLELLTLHDRALALPNALASDRRLKERLCERLEEILHISIDFEVVHPGKRLKVWAKPTGNNRGETLFVNEGTGANQVPFIFVPVLLTPPNETILLSEPEAHFHPKGQCDLTRMLLTVAKKDGIQFFIETHSEHVLHTILNAVARGEWSPADVALYYFQNKNGTAEVSKREINQFGQVDGGLPDFFEQSLAELTDYLKALSKP